jgi:hypothetical protein
MFLKSALLVGVYQHSVNGRVSSYKQSDFDLI